MAELEKIYESPFDLGKTKILNRKFGRPEDNIELHIYDGNDNLIYTDEDFNGWTFPKNITGNLSSEIIVDPQRVLSSYGFNNGNYNIRLNIHRRKIFTGLDSFKGAFTKDFKITEISPSRTEIRATAGLGNEGLEQAVGTFIRDLQSSVFFKEFGLNFGDNKIPVGVNVLLNKRKKKFEVLFKLFEPLPSGIKKNNSFRVIESISDPISININMGSPKLSLKAYGESLQGPNFKIDVRLNNSVPSEFKNLNQLLEYSVTSSYEHLLSKLENREVPNIVYDYIRPVSGTLEGIDVPYHFENFIHFSSAEERLKNFEYKLKLIELYDKELSALKSIPGATANTTFVLKDIKQKGEKRLKLIKGLDGYEKYLYFESGAYSWPKQTTSTPHVNYSVSSSQALNWLGSDNDFSNHYGGQLLSASLFDRQNQNILEKLLPEHIKDKDEGGASKLFVNMLGQHFDQIWTYIKATTEINNTHHTQGISRDLVFYTLKSLGLETFDQFENANLIEYILGEGSTGSAFYDTPTNHTLVTASNAGSIPKEDITKNIWKRLYHNAPYLLKTKGTERGVKALMSCYGVPSSLLNVKEYGGPTKNLDLHKDTTYKIYSYDKAGLALKGDSGGSGHFVKFPWANMNVGTLNSKTVELRIKPFRDIANDAIALKLGAAELKIEAYTGGDIYEFGDATKFGNLKVGAAVTATFPLYDGDFWNIYMAQTNGGTMEFGAYKANHTKNVFKYTQTVANTYNSTFGNSSGAGATWVYGGYHDYSGSIQELKANWGEKLTDLTLTKHALEPFMYAGNTPSSSYTNVLIRLPLGSNDFRSFENFPPNESSTHNTTVGTSTATTTWEEVVETHYHPTPDSVGASMTSEKVRIDTGTIDDDILSTTLSCETSTLDRVPQDYEDLGIFFSPTSEINEDIVYTLGGFRLDDYIGSPLPSVQTASDYVDLQTMNSYYFRKVSQSYNYWEYTKLIQYIDHTLFKLIEQWVPFKANTKTGLLIEPHYLERSKFRRELPIINDGQTMIPASYTTINARIDPERAFTIQSSSVVFTSNLLSGSHDAEGFRKTQGLNATIDIDDYILDEPQNGSQSPIIPFSAITGKPAGYVAYSGSALLGNATEGRKSSIYHVHTRDSKQLHF